MKTTRLLKAFGAVLIVCLMFMATGCATIIQGGTQEVPINSRPDGATVEVFNMDGMLIWNSTTPATAILDKGDGYFSGANYRIVISKKGYRSQELFLRSHLSIWYLAGNLLWNALAPFAYLVIDPLTGAMWRLDPEVINAGLNESATLDTEADGLVVMLLEEVPESLVASLVPIAAN